MSFENAIVDDSYDSFALKLSTFIQRNWEASTKYFENDYTWNCPFSHGDDKEK